MDKELSKHQQDAIDRHREDWLQDFPDRTTDDWVLDALQHALADINFVNQILEQMGAHPLTWTPPLIEIALERLEDDNKVT